jgi:hypothetical protein
VFRADGRQLVPGHVSPAMRVAPVTGRVEASTPMTLTIALPSRDLAGARDAADKVADPKSPSFRHYLTPEEFAEKFGPTQADYDRMVDWARSKSFTVQTHRNRLAATVTATAADVERAFDVRLDTALRADGTTFFGPDDEPTVDLALPVQFISGLTDYFVPKPATGSGVNGEYQGKDFRNAYVPDTQLNGSGQAIGLYMSGGFVQPDIDGYAAMTGQNFLPIQSSPLNPYPATANTDIEGTLDIEATLSMAPAAMIFVFTGDHHQILVNMADSPNVRQLSMSYIWEDGNDADTQEHLAISLNGQSFFEASGDDGTNSPTAVWNAQSGGYDTRKFPYVTLVGGTALNMAGDGSSYGTLEKGWGGSTGGIIPIDAIPSYQSGIAGLNLASTTYRNFPDVSAQADDNNVWYFEGRVVTGIGGTSVASPLWAGFMALVNQQAAESGLPAVGFANPTLYAVGSGTNYGIDFNDVVSGCAPNAHAGQDTSVTYCAGTGYDLVTGLGSPTASLISSLANPTCRASNSATSCTGICGQTFADGCGGTYTCPACPYVPAPNCAFSVPGTFEVVNGGGKALANVSGTPDSGNDPILVFEETSTGGWTQASAIDVTSTTQSFPEKAGATLTLLCCSVPPAARTSYGGPDGAPVGPGDNGCDASPTTITLPPLSACVPTVTCASLHAQCATVDDCGNPLACGTCPITDICDNGTCYRRPRGPCVECGGP